jgi:hypothetical protein
MSADRLSRGLSRKIVCAHAETLRGGRVDDRQAVIETVLGLGRALDAQDWAGVRACLAAQLDTDYSSFRGTPPSRLAAEEFIRLRRTGLHGLLTQHLSSDHEVDIAGDEAVCRCAFVIRRWPADLADRRVLHSYGSYVYRLRRVEGIWRIAGITQVVERSEGDPQLHGAFRAPEPGTG